MSELRSSDFNTLLFSQKPQRFTDLAISQARCSDDTKWAEEETQNHPFDSSPLLRFLNFTSDVATDKGGYEPNEKATNKHLLPKLISPH